MSSQECATHGDQNERHGHCHDGYQPGFCVYGEAYALTRCQTDNAMIAAADAVRHGTDST